MTTPTTTPAHHPLPVTLDELAAVVKAKGVHFYVATPAYGCKLTSRYVLSLLKFQATCLSKGIEISVDFLGNESLITRGRSIMAARFLKTNATHLLFLDADVGFDPLSLLRMAAFEKDVVCGIYSKKSIDWAALRQRLLRGDNPNEPIDSKGLDFNINVKPENEGETEIRVHDGFVKVHDAATGCMLISKDTLQQLAEEYRGTLAVKNDIPGSRDTVPDYVALFDTEICPETRRWLSEDYGFCRKCQRAGRDVWADLSAPLSHTGTLQLAGDAMQRTMVSFCAR